MQLRGAGSAAMALVAMIAAGCTSVTMSGGPPASPPPSSVASASPASAAPVTAAPRVTADPWVTRPSVPPAAPPPASLEGLPGGGAVPGELGSYTWDGFASDGPWIVGTARHATATGVPVRVSFAAGLAPASWAAAWAEVRDGKPGTPIAAGSGSDAISVVVPTRPGDWSLQVSASFSEGRQATWFWLLAAAP
jgi:hypothetical protein